MKLSESNKITIDDIHDYLKLWYHPERWTDFNMAYDSGYTHYAAYLIYSNGAIDSSMCYEYAKPIERAIERLMKRYHEDHINKDLDGCFRDAIVYINDDTNEHAFIKNKYVDYLMDDEQMLELGYKRYKGV